MVPLLEVIFELKWKITNRIIEISDILSNARINNEISSEIKKEIWIKAIINSSINPITAIFQCHNGYLMENPILRQIYHDICNESTIVANAIGYDLKIEDMIERTEKVIMMTKENTSSMLQSIQKNKKTEISSINGSIIEHGRQNGCSVSLNSILVQIIKKMYGYR